MQKREELPTLNELVSFIISIVVIICIGLAIFVYLRPNVDPNSQSNLNEFVKLYNDCSKLEENNCKCGVFDVGKLARGHSISLEEATGEKPYIMASVRVKGGKYFTTKIDADKLCWLNEVYGFDTQMNPDPVLVNTELYDYMGFIRNEEGKVCLARLRSEDSTERFGTNANAPINPSDSLFQDTHIYFNEDFKTCGIKKFAVLDAFDTGIRGYKDFLEKIKVGSKERTILFGPGILYSDYSISNKYWNELLPVRERFLLNNAYDINAYLSFYFSDYETNSKEWIEVYYIKTDFGNPYSETLAKSIVSELNKMESGTAKLALPAPLDLNLYGDSKGEENGYSIYEIDKELTSKKFSAPAIAIHINKNKYKSADKDALTNAILQGLVNYLNSVRNIKTIEDGKIIFEVS